MAKKKPAAVESQALFLLSKARAALDEVLAAKNVGSVKAWEFRRRRAGRPDPMILSETRDEITAFLANSTFEVSLEPLEPEILPDTGHPEG